MIILSENSKILFFSDHTLRFSENLSILVKKKINLYDNQWAFDSFEMTNLRKMMFTDLERLEENMEKENL